MTLYKRTMKIFNVCLFLILTIPLSSQVELNANQSATKKTLFLFSLDSDSTWQQSIKLKIDGLNIVDQYPSLIIGIEYPINADFLTIEHEIGPIFNSAAQDVPFDKSSGFKTAHTLMLDEGNFFAVGIGVNYRYLRLQGALSACAQESDGSCAYWRLFEDGISHQRFAGYLRIRNNLIGQRIAFNYGIDLGRQFQKFINPEFEAENLRLEDLRLFDFSNLNLKSAPFIRYFAQIVIRL